LSKRTVKNLSEARRLMWISGPVKSCQ